MVESAVVDTKEPETVPEETTEPETEETSETASEETQQTAPERTQAQMPGVEEQSRVQNDTSETGEPEMEETGGKNAWTDKSFSYLIYVISRGVLIVIIVFVLKAAGRKKRENRLRYSLCNNHL